MNLPPPRSPAASPLVEEADPARPKLSSDQWKLARRALAALGILSTGSMIGVSFSLYLVTHYPLLLVALSPLGRHVVLAAPTVDPVVLTIVVVARRMLFYGASFYLGKALGPTGIVWLEARSPWFGRFVRFMEQLFSRAASVVVLVMAGPTVSALAGMSGMRIGVFVPLATLGLIPRMVLLIAFAEWARPYIEIALQWIDRYWLPGTVVMVAGVALYQWRTRGQMTAGAGILDDMDEEGRRD